MIAFFRVCNANLPYGLVTQQQPIRHHFILQSLPFQLKASEHRASTVDEDSFSNSPAGAARFYGFLANVGPRIIGRGVEEAGIARMH
jgi:hypothetical protein